MKLALLLLAAAVSPLLSIYAQDAKTEFSAERGKALFTGHFTGGKPETPSCTTCHTQDPKNHGQIMHEFEVHIGAHGKPVATFLRRVE